jgi:hypothetical protein
VTKYRRRGGGDKLAGSQPLSSIRPDFSFAFGRCFVMLPTAPSIVWFAAIQGIKCKHDLAGPGAKRVTSYRLRRLSEGSRADEAGKQVWLLMGDWFSKILPGPLVVDSDFSGLDRLLPHKLDDAMVKNDW